MFSSKFYSYKLEFHSSLSSVLNSVLGLSELYVLTLDSVGFCCILISLESSSSIKGFSIPPNNSPFLITANFAVVTFSKHLSTGFLQIGHFFISLIFAQLSQTHLCPHGSKIISFLS